MYWNNRVMKKVPNPKYPDDEQYYVVEVYYNNDNAIVGWTEEESAWGETLEALESNLEWMLKALDKPVLDEALLLAASDRLRAEVTVGSYEEIGINPSEVEVVHEKE